MTTIFNRPFSFTAQYSNGFPISGCTYIATIFACDTIPNSIKLYSSSVLINGTKYTVWDTYPLVSSASCASTGSTPIVTASSPYSRLWIANDPTKPIDSCSFTFTNTSNTVQTIAPTSSEFVIVGDTLLNNTAPIYLVSITSAVSTDAFMYVTNLNAPIPPVSVSALEYSITEVATSVNQALVYQKLFTKGTNTGADYPYIGCDLPTTACPPIPVAITKYKTVIEVSGANYDVDGSFGLIQNVLCSDASGEAEITK